MPERPSKKSPGTLNYSSEKAKGKLRLNYGEKLKSKYHRIDKNKQNSGRVQTRLKKLVNSGKAVVDSEARGKHSRDVVISCSKIKMRKIGKLDLTKDKKRKEKKRKRNSK